jgi:sulfur carrier protein ThiS adenylyltransferase
VIDKEKIRLLRIATAVHDGLLGFHQRRKAEAMSSVCRLNETLDELRQMQHRFMWAEQRNMQAAMTSQIDQASVEELNLPVQGYLETDRGRPKVEATAGMCRRLNSQVELHTEQGRFRRSMEIGNVILTCVDKIDTRRLIWEAVKDKVDFWVDGRMLAEVLRVLTACDTASRRHYSTTLFAQEEAFVGACTARSTIFCANIAAGMMVGQLTKWLRGLPVEPDLMVNLLASELTVAS